MSEQELVNIVIDGHALTVPRGEMIIESARRVGIEIPHFCYHPRLSKEAGANCRMCLVEVSMPRKNPDGTTTLAKMPKPQTSCSLPAEEGMVIETESPVVVEARRGILEFLLINHPLDCPICDRGGECPLQNNTLHYGPPTTRFVEEKRHVAKAYPLSDYVVLDRERCIHCARCTRFAEDIAGDAQLGFLKRGADMEVSARTGTQFTSLFSGNVIELCPVGALLSRQYRFKARPWDLATQKSICSECSNGCNIKLDHRMGAFVRVNARTNEAVNEEWTCDRGKFGMAHISSPERVRGPLIRRGDRFVPSGWKEALDYVAARLQEAGPRSAFIGGSLSFNEDLYVIQRLFREVLGSGNLDHRLGTTFPATDEILRLIGHEGALGSIAGLEEKGTIVVFGSDLAVEQPIVYLRVRKAWRLFGAQVVDVQPSYLRQQPHANRTEAFASLTWTYEPSTRQEAAKEIAQLLMGREESSAAIADGPATVILGRDVVCSSDLMVVLETLNRARAERGGQVEIALPASYVNEQGARLLGILPDKQPGLRPTAQVGCHTLEILERCGTGSIQFLWVSGINVAKDFADREKAVRCLEETPFTVYSGLHFNETARMADVVLPTCSVAEQDGTYTNVERRVQRVWKAYQPSLDVREEWRIAAGLAGRLGRPMPYASWRDVLSEIATSVPGFEGCGPDMLGDEGVLCRLPSQGDGAA